MVKPIDLLVIIVTIIRLYEVFHYRLFKKILHGIGKTGLISSVLLVRKLRLNETQ